MANRRRSFDHSREYEDKRTWDLCDRSKVSRRISYHNDQRSDPEGGHDIHRSSIRRDYTRLDDDRPRSPPPPANVTSYGSNRKPSTAGSPPWHDSELKGLIDFLCDKMWWRVQCEHERKKEQKLYADRERCPPSNPETVHYSDILRLQIEQCQKARKKYSDRMSIADDKFMAGITQLVERHAPGTLNSPGATNSGVQIEKVDVKLETLRKTVDALVKQRKKEQEESNKLSSTTSAKLLATTAAQSELSKETDELRKSLELERLRNDRLEKRLEEMEQKFNSLSQRQDKLAQDTASNTQSGKAMAEDSVQITKELRRLDSIAVNTVTRGELKMALEQFDDVISSSAVASHMSRQEALSFTSGNKTRQYLRQLSSIIEDIKSSLGYDAGSTIPQCIVNLQGQVSSCTESIQSHSKQSSIMSEALKTLEESICSLQYTREQKQEHSPSPPSPPPPSKTITIATTSLLPTPPTPPPPQLLSASNAVSQQDIDTQMARLSATLTGDIQKKMQEKLAQVAQQLGSFIDKERCERERASDKANNACSKVESLSQSIDGLNKHVHDSVQKLDSLCGHILTQLRQYNDGLRSFDSRLQHLAMEHAHNVEELALQVRVVNTWQSNFTTKPLYLDIVGHINRTLPNGIHSRVSTLASRVDAVESQLKEGEATSLKKRKLQE
ncbi:hypothetical protein E4U21_001378 [Claviceps maximensis]|nr:hypothetical protein E4U21_001378 [Claviceps maximensis]